jgi:hypothetical protein
MNTNNGAIVYMTKRMLNEEYNRLYMKECNKYPFSNGNTNTKPLYFYSYRVYLAYNNLWKLINRSLITNDEL